MSVSTLEPRVEDDASLVIVPPERDWSRYWLVALTGLTLLALGVRLWQLGEDAVWLDEAFSYTFAQGLDVVNGDANHPPGYYALLWLWNLIGSGSLWWSRLLSVLLGTAAIPVTAAVGRTLDRPATGLIAGLFLALSPLQIQHAQDVRQYSLLVLCAAVMIWALAQVATRGSRTGVLAVYVGGALVAMWSHSGGVVIFATVNLAALSVWAVRRLRHRALPWRTVKRWLVATLIAVSGFAPWLLSFFGQVGENSVWVPWGGTEQVWEVQRFVAVGYLPDTSWQMVAVGATWLVLAVVGLWLLRHTTWSIPLAVLWLGAPLMLIVLSVSGIPVYSGRSILWTAVPLYLAAAVAVARFAEWKRMGTAVLGLTLVIGLAGYYLDGGWFEVEPRDYAEVTEALVERVEADDVVLLSPGWMVHLVEYHWRRDHPDISQPRFVGLQWGWTEPSVENAAQGYDTVWFVESLDYPEADPDTQTLDLLEDLGGDVQRVETNDYTQVFRVEMPDAVADQPRVEAESFEF